MKQSRKSQKANYWNHRVIRHSGDSEWPEPYFVVAEVYYTDGRPVIATLNGAEVGAESVEGLRWILQDMLKCLEVPALDAEIFMDRKVKVQGFVPKQDTTPAGRSGVSKADS